MALVSAWGWVSVGVGAGEWAWRVGAQVRLVATETELDSGAFFFTRVAHLFHSCGTPPALLQHSSCFPASVLLHSCIAAPVLLRHSSCTSAALLQHSCSSPRALLQPPPALLHIPPALLQPSSSTPAALLLHSYTLQRSSCTPTTFCTSLLHSCNTALLQHISSTRAAFLCTSAPPSVSLTAAVWQ